MWPRRFFAASRRHGDSGCVRFRHAVVGSHWPRRRCVRSLLLASFASRRRRPSSLRASRSGSVLAGRFDLLTNLPAARAFDSGLHGAALRFELDERANIDLHAGGRNFVGRDRGFRARNRRSSMALLLACLLGSVHKWALDGCRAVISSENFSLGLWCVVVFGPSPEIASTSHRSSRRRGDDRMASLRG